MVIYMTTGNKIKRARIYRGLTQKELADKLEVKAATISAFEKDRTNIKQLTLMKIADALNLGLSYTKTGEPYFYAFIDTVHTGSPEEEKALAFNNEQTQDLNTYINVNHDMSGQYNNMVNSITEAILNEEEKSKILKSYSKLNQEGKAEAVKRMEELTLIEKYTK